MTERKYIIEIIETNAVWKLGRQAALGGVEKQFLNKLELTSSRAVPSWQCPDSK